MSVAIWRRDPSTAGDDLHTNSSQIWSRGTRPSMVTSAASNDDPLVARGARTARRARDARIGHHPTTSRHLAGSPPRADARARAAGITVRGVDVANIVKRSIDACRVH